MGWQAGCSSAKPTYWLAGGVPLLSGIAPALGGATVYGLRSVCEAIPTPPSACGRNLPKQLILRQVALVGRHLAE